MKVSGYLLIAVFISLSACTTKEIQAVRGNTVGNKPLQMNSVRVLDPSLINQKKSTFGSVITRTRIAIEGETLSVTDTDLLKIRMILRNQTDHALALEGRTTWYDGDEFPVDGPTAWKRLMIPPKTSMTYVETSIDERSTYYHVDIREAR